MLSVQRATFRHFSGLCLFVILFEGITPVPQQLRPPLQDTTSKPELVTYQYKYDIGFQYHNESKDKSGTVKGEYGYWSPDGWFRITNYTADKNGYRATRRRLRGRNGQFYIGNGNGPSGIPPILNNRPQGYRVNATGGVGGIYGGGITHVQNTGGVYGQKYPSSHGAGGLPGGAPGVGGLPGGRPGTSGLPGGAPGAGGLPGGRPGTSGLPGGAPGTGGLPGGAPGAGGPQGGAIGATGLPGGRPGASGLPGGAPGTGGLPGGAPGAGGLPGGTPGAGGPQGGTYGAGGPPGGAPGAGGPQGGTYGAGGLPGGAPGAGGPQGGTYGAGGLPGGAPGTGGLPGGRPGAGGPQGGTYGAGGPQGGTYGAGGLPGGAPGAGGPQGGAIGASGLPGGRPGASGLPGKAPGAGGPQGGTYGAGGLPGGAPGTGGLPGGRPGAGGPQGGTYGAGGQPGGGAPGTGGIPGERPGAAGLPGGAPGASGLPGGAPGAGGLQGGTTGAGGLQGGAPGAGAYPQGPGTGFQPGTRWPSDSSGINIQPGGGSEIPFSAQIPGSSGVFTSTTQTGYQPGIHGSGSGSTVGLPGDQSRLPQQPGSQTPGFPGQVNTNGGLQGEESGSVGVTPNQGVKTGIPPLGIFPHVNAATPSSVSKNQKGISPQSPYGTSGVFKGRENSLGLSSTPTPLSYQPGLTVVRPSWQPSYSNGGAYQYPVGGAGPGAVPGYGPGSSPAVPSIPGYSTPTRTKFNGTHLIYGGPGGQPSYPGQPVTAQPRPPSSGYAPVRYDFQTGQASDRSCKITPGPSANVPVGFPDNLKPLGVSRDDHQAENGKMDGKYTLTFPFGYVMEISYSAYQDPVLAAQYLPQQHHTGNCK